jgi:hypothetical protein
VLSLENNDPIFYIKEGDWRKQVRQCTKQEWDQDHNRKVEYKLPEDEYENIVLMFREFASSGTTFFTVKLKENEHKMQMVNRKNFNPTIHMLNETKETLKKRESNTSSMIKAKSAPGFATSTVRTSGDRGSMFHNNRLDEGAMGDLLDKGLEGAKHRAEFREKKLGKGKAFSRRSYGRRIRNGKGKRR